MINCSPKELIFFLLERLAFSGNIGLSVNDLWDQCEDKLTEIDDFTKQIIWKWLFYSPLSKDKLFLWCDNSKLETIESYQEFLSSIPNINNVRIFPTGPTQWDYLVGNDVSDQVKTSIGKFPFELLCEIAKHGSKGILTSELSKATGQDPRSSTPRLKKLEELNLIIKKNFYHKESRQHTSICTHTRFVTENHADLNSLEYDDFQITRDGAKVRTIIMEKVKQAPNQLRSLVDLRNELKLNNDFSINRFFRVIIKSLCSKGYLSKVIAKQDQEGPSVVCVKFEKDLPSDGHTEDILDIFGKLGDEGNDNNDDQEDEEEEEEEEEEELPLYSNFFPIVNQIFQQIDASPEGLSSMNISKNITGIHDHRPTTRLMDIITSTVTENGKVKNLKKLGDTYDGKQISRSYDFEGKFKFYRYFTKGNVPTVDLSKSGNSKVGKLSQLNKKHYIPIGKIMSGTLLENNKRKISEEDKPIKKMKPVRKVRQKQQSVLSELEIEDDSMIVDELSKDKDSETDKEFEIKEKKPKESKELKEPILPLNFQPGEKQTTANKNMGSTSLKATRRREVLMEIIKSEGGVTYTSADLRRKLDKQLDNSYSTDRKTLSRDIAGLIHDGLLECQDIHTIKTGQPITRKLLILVDPRPSDERIEEVRFLGEVSTGTENLTYRNYYSDLPVASDNVTFFAPRPSKRLGKLSDDKPGRRTTTTKVRIKQENGGGSLSKGRKGGSKISIEGVEDDQAQETKGFDSLVNANIKVRKSTRRKPIQNPSNFRKSRVLKLSEKESTLMYRMFIITRTFKRSIDYERLSTFFQGFTVRDMQQKWSNLRKQRGGLEGVIKNVNRFEKIVSKAVEQGKVESKHLDPIDFMFFIELWENSDIKTSKSQKRLYFSSADNYEDFNVTVINEVPTSLADELYLNSMVQKEEILANNPFFYKAQEQLEVTEEDKVKTSLRALAKEDNFSKEILERVFGLKNTNLVTQVVQTMVNEREATLFDNTFRFTEKFQNCLLPSKVISQFHQSYKFFNNLTSVLENAPNKGIILSEGISDSHMMSILNLASDLEISVFHINRPYKFQGYESRLIDKSKLDCEIIIKDNNIDIRSYKHVPVPTGKISSHVWFRTDASIDTDLWSKIVVSLIYYISFHPGIPQTKLYYKFKSALTVLDLSSVLDWLQESGYVSKGNYNDYWVKSQWFSVIG